MVYDEDKINDSLEFVEQIRFYKEQDDCIHTEDKKITSDIPLYFSDKTEYPIETTEKVVRSIAGDFLYIIVCAVVSILLAYGVTHFVAHHTRVDGNSMNDTLTNNDYLMIEKISYYIHDPERFDIVVFPYSKDVNYIKRVIGLPGETVQIKDGKVYINDKLLSSDTYGKEIIQNAGTAENPITLGDDEYFVLGDNRNSSYDSRKPAVGLIKRDKIAGKAVFRFWPFDSFGGIS